MRAIETEKTWLGGLQLRALTLIAIAVAATAVLWISAPSAWGASSYHVYECNNAESRSAPDARPSGDYNAGDAGGGLSSIQYAVTCDGSVPQGEGWGKGVVLHPSGYHPGPRWARVAFNAPPTTYFDHGSFRYDIGARYPCSGLNCWYAGAYVGIWTGSMQATPTAGTESWGSSCGFWCRRIYVDESCPSTCMHAASDPGGNANEWYYDYIAIRNIDVTVVDTESPSLTLGGSLFDGQQAHGTPNLQIDASDRGSGIEDVSVKVNGVWVANPGTDCPWMPADRDYATRFRPCSDFHRTVGLDTERTPWRDGSNTLRVCVSDVATGPGVANSVCEQRTISVDNSCPDSSGASGRADSISAGLENPRTGKLSRTRAVRSNDGSALLGHLSGSGGPVKAASVCVYEAVDEPAGIEQLVQVAKSSSTGQFGVQIPGGPSRTFRVAYRYAGHQIQSPSMYLDSSVLPTLRLSKSKLSNGRAVGFRGRIPGPDYAGRAVTMQAKVGKKWRSFKQLQTDGNGQFRGKYRFTQTRGKVLYVFRALVKKQGGYPYSPGASAKRKLLVRG